MSATSDEALRLLRECHAMLRTMAAPQPDAPPAPSKTLRDAELDGKYGDPEIRAKSPRDWAGEPMTGKRFSECPPAYLDLLAERFDFFNTKETDEKKRGYNTRDAVRARGWAARQRAGWKPTPATITASASFPSSDFGKPFGDDDESIAF